MSMWTLAVLYVLIIYVRVCAVVQGKVENYAEMNAAIIATMFYAYNILCTHTGKVQTRVFVGWCIGASKC